MKRLLLSVTMFFLLSPVFAGEIEPVAVVLSGGGARGAYQIGVWKAMLDIGIDIGGIYGVSVGAINGAVMAGSDFEAARDLWKKLEKDNVMSIPDSGKQLISGEFSFGALVDTTDELITEGGIDVSPLEDLLSSFIDEQAIRNSGIDYGLAAYSLTERELKYLYLDDIPEGKLVDYILASANFPAFQRKKINGDYYIDGGVQKNTAVELVDSARFDSVVVVGLDVYTPADVYDWATGFWSYDFDVTLIRPQIELGSMLDFTPRNALRLMKAGYLDALRAFGVLPAGRYYIYGSRTVARMFDELSSSERRTALERLGIKIPSLISLSESDWLFEELIEPVLELPGLDSFALFEGLGFIYGLPVIDLYSEADFLRRVNKEYVRRGYDGVLSNPSLDFISYLVSSTEDVEFKYNEIDDIFLESWSGF